VPESAHGAWKPSCNPWLIALAVMLATFMEVMDTSIAAVAVPYIAGSVSASNNEATWVLTSYLVANAVFLPSSAWFSLRYGRKRYLMFSVLVFTIASFLCGIAGSLGFILIARAIQGAGGGALQPLSQAILIESFPPEKQGRALGVFAMGVVVAPVLGPTLGGYLTDAISWRWAFYINIPIGIAALILQHRFLEDPPYIRDADPGRLDKIGFILLAIWAGCLQFICDKGQEDDWFGSERIRWAFAFFVGAFLVFIVLQMVKEKPLMNLRVLADRNFAVGCLLIFMFGATVYAITTILPLFYQTLLAYSAVASGLAVAPRGLGSFAGALIAGRLTDKMDSRFLIAFGLAVLVGANFWTGSLTLQISPTSLFWPIVITGVAFPFVFIPISGLALGTLPPVQIGNASGIFNLMRNLGGSIGIAMSTTLIQRHLQTHRNDMVHWVTTGRPEIRQFLSRITAFMSTHYGQANAMARARVFLNQIVNQQAQAWAYVDVLRYVAIVCAVCIPVAFVFKNRKRAGAAG
jgi:DHA2 family multidrug resistance protein